MRRDPNWDQQSSSPEEAVHTSHRREEAPSTTRTPGGIAGARIKLGYVARALRITWAAASRWTAVWAVLLLFQGAVPAIMVYLTKLLVDAITGAIGGGLSWENLAPVMFPAGAMAGLMILGQVLQNAVIWVRTAQAEHVTDHIKQLIHTKTAAVDLEFYDIPEYFDHMQRANEEADRRVLSILENTGTLAQNAITLIAIAALLIPYGWWVPFVLIASTLPALAVIVMHQRIYHAWWRGTTQERRWAQYFDMVITRRECAQEVRLFGLSEEFRRSYQTIRGALRKSHIRLLRNQRLASVAAGVLALGATGAIMVWIVRETFLGQQTLGAVALFYQAFNQGQSIMRTLLGSVGTLYTDALFLEHLFTFLDIDARVTAPESPREVPATVERGISVENVTFRYPGSEVVALRDFNLFIPAGKTVAIVGKNGAGKSTLVKLLCRFYDPTSGRVTWDGEDIRHFDAREMWRRVTVLFQTPVNYAGTMAQSIAYGDKTVEPTPERIRTAGAAAGADSVAATLPEGYDTRLGIQFEGGVDLSGGQWQRVALARAFFRRAPLVLLDEPTSFMDSWAEMQWLERLRRLVADRTALIVTHRFTTAMRADLIYVMEEGQVVESGTHQELVGLGGLYAASWQAQVQAESESQVLLP